jgi:hypothetical protein
LRIAYGYLVALALGACGGTDPLLGPSGALVPLTLESVTGRWEERARIYAKLGAQTGVLRDTVSVAGTDQIIYQFNLDGANIVRRVQPDPGQAILRIEPTGDGMSWVIGRFQSFYAQLTATRLSLNDGVSEPHVFPHDDFPTSAQVTHVYFRAAAAAQRAGP